MAEGWRNWNPVWRLEGAVETPEQQPAAGLRPVSGPGVLNRQNCWQAGPQAGSFPRSPTLEAFFQERFQSLEWAGNAPSAGLGWGLGVPGGLGRNGIRKFQEYRGNLRMTKMYNN